MISNWDPSNEILEELMNIHIGLNIEPDREERYWEQQLRINWLKNSDKNTSFFHKMAMS